MRRRVEEESYKRLYEEQRFLYQLGRDLERISLRTPDSHLLRVVLRRLGEVFEADVAIQTDVRYPDPCLETPYRLVLSKLGGSVDARTMASLEEHFHASCSRILAGKPLGPVRREVLLYGIDPDERLLAIVGFVRLERPFNRGQLHFGQVAMRLVSDRLIARERERERSLREKISTKIFSELRPKDVLYQILHGLKKLFRYDHSGAVFLLGPDRRTLTVQAEIVVWTKAKSERIGDEVRLDDEVVSWLAGDERRPLLIRDGRPLPSPHGNNEIPAQMLRPLLPTGEGSPEARSMLVAVLWRKERILGVIQLLGRGPQTFSPENRVTLEKFLPLAAITMFNSELYTIQHNRMVSAERKVGLADLARAISHDLNNAFGVILPLLQAVQRDVAGGQLDRERLLHDLAMIEHYANFSSRIFQGLLSIGRGASEPYSWTRLAPLLDTALGMVEPNLVTNGIRLEWRVDPDVPTICVRHGEIEQLILNLVYNARDAMPEGGKLNVTARRERGGVRIELTDTGVGIPREIREKIFEPFFTTRPTGSGLGLDICRSIVWEYGGTLDLADAAPRGTTASIWLPRSTDRIPAELRAAGAKDEHETVAPGSSA